MHPRPAMPSGHDQLVLLASEIDSCGRNETRQAKNRASKENHTDRNRTWKQHKEGKKACMYKGQQTNKQIYE